ncbi:uncharacterized protein LOC128680166 [Plodia interpunctella]|uniref:uncharacterized protein LOC128680166 n=1 Tax=Plodia interpunctella TaxID=58824 RepID=UPI002368BF0D|nr:uncharacterized protein LOC128680166 [Plodia interpunctella]
MPLPFTKTLDLRLIKLVKDNPMLYDLKHMKYMDVDTKEVVWQKIGDELNRPSQMCRSRWVNMRDMMRKRVKERVRNPSNNRPYKYEDELSFLFPYFKDITSSEDSKYSEYYEEETDIDMPNDMFVEYNKDRLLTMPVTNENRNESASNFEALSQELSATDPLDVFLITIGTTLRKFTPYYLNQAKSKIFQVVQDYELQQIVDKDDKAGLSDSKR